MASTWVVGWISLFFHGATIIYFVCGSSMWGGSELWNFATSWATVTYPWVKDWLFGPPHSCPIPPKHWSQMAERWLECQQRKGNLVNPTAQEMFQKGIEYQLPKWWGNQWGKGWHPPPRMFWWVESCRRILGVERLRTLLTPLWLEKVIHLPSLVPVVLPGKGRYLIKLEISCFLTRTIVQHILYTVTHNIPHTTETKVHETVCVTYCFSFIQFYSMLPPFLLPNANCGLHNSSVGHSLHCAKHWRKWSASSQNLGKFHL
jgi:hypothetical protein